MQIVERGPINVTDIVIIPVLAGALVQPHAERLGITRTAVQAGKMALNLKATTDEPRIRLAICNNRNPTER
jgi:hypothetical protein